jgi:DNA-binding HxlR family transcriptional regulator
MFLGDLIFLFATSFVLSLANCKCKDTYYFQTASVYSTFMKQAKKRSDCPISCSLDIWGDKWSLLIIRDLMFAKECTYGDFLKAPEGIATNILASRLEVLERNKIIEKLDHPESRAKVLYRLTKKGIDLLPIMMEINLWAEKYFTIPQERKAMLKEMKKDKVAFIKSTTRELESRTA